VKHVLSSALAGAAFGAIVAWLVARPGAGGPESENAAELRPVLADLTRAIADLRNAIGPPEGKRALSPATPPQVPVPSEGAAPDAQAGAAPRRLSPPPLAAEPMRGSPRALTPPPNRARVSALATSWDAETEGRAETTARREWLFSTEQEALDAFGTPDEIWGGADEEKWVYNLVAKDEDGGEVNRSYTLVFWNGRLRQIL
jgi:hypothetical protein